MSPLSFFLCRIHWLISNFHYWRFRVSVPWRYQVYQWLPNIVRNYNSNKSLLYLLVSLEYYRKHFHISVISRFSHLPWRIGRAHISYPSKAGKEALSASSLLVPAWGLERGVCGQCCHCPWSSLLSSSTESPAVFHLSSVSLEEPGILSHVTAMSELHQCRRSCSFLSEIRWNLQITLACCLKLLIWNCRFQWLWNTGQGLDKSRAGS